MKKDPDKGVVEGEAGEDHETFSNEIEKFSHQDESVATSADESIPATQPQEIDIEMQGNGNEGVEGSSTTSTEIESNSQPATEPADDNEVVYVTATPLHKGKVIPLMLLLFAETFNSNSIFPYLVFMLADFHLVDDQRDLGYLD